MRLGDKLMKVIIKVKDVVEMVRRFERSPGEAMHELVMHAREGVRESIERVMEAEIGLFLGQPAQKGNKRNGYTTRTSAERDWEP
jgi:transposase-like protein